MREILFRGKRKDNGKWVYGYYSYCTDGNILSHRIYIGFGEGYGTNKLSDVWYEVIPETVGQYTGLTDKDGTEIFEGDIVLHKNQKDFIFYDEELAAFVCKDSFQKGASWLYTHEFELIGNIFENPELLKAGE